MQSVLPNKLKMLVSFRFIKLKAEKNTVSPFILSEKSEIIIRSLCVF